MNVMLEVLFKSPRSIDKYYMPVIGWIQCASQCCARVCPCTREPDLWENTGPGTARTSDSVLEPEPPMAIGHL